MSPEKITHTLVTAGNSVTCSCGWKPEFMTWNRAIALMQWADHTEEKS